MDAWKSVRVASTTHSIKVLPARAPAKADPIAPNLIASLPHPEKKAHIARVIFSPDSKRLFTTGYPSGIVQIWDWAAKKELRRIETPPGYRGSSDYALLTPDWTTLYVPVEKRTVKRFEKDGKTAVRFEYSGQVRVWDVASGMEKKSLLPAEGTAPVQAKLSPDGRFLVCVERPGYDSGDTHIKDSTVVCDLNTGKKWKLCDGYSFPSFSPDQKTVAVDYFTDVEARISGVRILDFHSGKEMARFPCPDKERFFSGSKISPDGKVVAVSLGGKKAAPVEVWFRDAKNLQERGKLIGKGDPERYGWGSGTFARDGKNFFQSDGIGNILVWDVAGQKLERTLPLGGEWPGGEPIFSPDGKTIAVGWVPTLPGGREANRDLDPQDRPQPRVTLLDLAGKSPPRILIAPHGYVGALAFSPDGKTLAFGGAGAVHLFDLTN